MSLQDRFEIRRRVGKGTQAEVFEAFDRCFGHLVALKVYAGTHNLEAMTREFRAVSHLSHPNLVQMHGLVLEREQAAIAMELFAEPLDPGAYRSASGEADVGALERLEAALTEGLSALHAANIIHGDIKPSNVMVKADRIALSDFGLARRFEDRRSLPAGGTPDYLAPELLTGSSSTPHSDLFALGVVLIECASGIRPRLAKRADRRIISHPWLEDSTPLKAAFPNTHERLIRFVALEPDKRGGLVPSRPVDRDRLPMVGRSQQLQIFSTYEDKVRTEGRSLRIDVVAPSGLGKSRLMREAQAQMTGPSLFVSCHPREVMPFAVVDALLEQLGEMGPAEPGSVAEDAQRLRADLFQVSTDRTGRAEAIVGRVVVLFERAAARRGLSIFVDDAQWGDEDSGRVISALLGLETPLILLALAFRPDDRSGTLVSAVSNRAVDVTIGLEPLPDSDVVRLVEARHDASLDAVPRRSIIERCGGHPFLATYLDSSDFMSEGQASEGFTARLAAVHPTALELCLCVRAAGFPVSRQVLLHAVEGDDVEGAFLALLEHGVLHRAGPRGEVELGHERLIDPAWQSLGDEERRRFHRTLASALSQTQGAAEQVAAQAHLGGDIEAAEQPARIAAERAFSVRAFRRAAGFESILLEAAEAKNREQAAVMHRYRIADAMAQAGDGTAAAAMLLEIARKTDDRTQLIRAEMKAAQYLLTAGNVQQGTELIQKVSDRLGLWFPRRVVARLGLMLWERTKLWSVDLQRVALRPNTDQDESTGLVIEYCWLLAAHFGLYEAHPGAQAKMLRLAAQTGRVDDLVRALATERAYAAVFGFRSKWIEQVEVLLARSEPRASASASAYALFARGFAELCVGGYAEAVELFRRSVQRAANERSATEFLDAAQLYSMASIALMGNYDEVTSAGLEARRAWLAEKKLGLVALFDTYIGYHIDLREGRPRDAIRRLRRASVSPGSSTTEYIRIFSLAGVLCAARRPRAARRLLWRNRGVLLAKSAEIYGRMAIAWFVFVAWAAVPRLSWWRRWSLKWVIRWCASSGHPAAVGLSKLATGILDLRTGRYEAGRLTLTAARASLHDLGMQSYARAADELLDGLAGQTPPPESRVHDVWRRYFRPAWPERGL